MAEDTKGVAGYVTTEDGEEIAISVEAVRGMIESHPLPYTEILDSGFTFTKMAPGLIHIRLSAFTNDELSADVIPIGTGDMVLADGPMFKVTWPPMGNEDVVLFGRPDMVGPSELGDGSAEISYTRVFIGLEGGEGTTRDSAVDKAEMMDGNVTDDNREAWEAFDPAELYVVHCNGRRVGVRDLSFGMAYYSGMVSAYREIERSANEGGGEEEAVPVTLAQYKTNKVLGNHDLALKALNGLVNIAYGEPYYEISPRRNSKSKESYRVTGSQDACARFFAERGGNAEQIKAVLETVGMLMRDERAPGFVKNGRVWFTLNTIVEEMSRTTAGTLQGRKCKASRELVDAALEAASSAQIKGVSPDGSPTNIIYPAPAVRLKTATYNGETYHDVWGFDAEALTVNSYADELGHTYAYALLKADKPLSIDEKAIDRYIRDVLNKVRGRLYTIGKNGKVTKKRVTKWVEELSWETIFATMRPTQPLDGRQKKKYVETFEKILKLQADMEKLGEARKGAPLYIKAYSVRDASRGRGKGAWSKLVIECTTSLREPDVNLG